MGRRGRDSAVARATLTVIEGSGPGVVPFRRPEPPDDLTDAQRKIWIETAKTEPTEFLDTTAKLELFRAYCCLISSVRMTQKEIDSFPMQYIRSKDGGRKYREMQAARALDLTKAQSILTTLRMTNQSRYTPQAAATQSKNPHKDKFPWE